MIMSTYGECCDGISLLFHSIDWICCKIELYGNTLTAIQPNEASRRSDAIGKVCVNKMVNFKEIPYFIKGIKFLASFLCWNQ